MNSDHHVSQEVNIVNVWKLYLLQEFYEIDIGF